MPRRPPPKSISRVKTGFFERRLELARVGLVSGSKVLTQTAASMLLNPAEREQKQKQIVAEQTRYLVSEIGKLKGSVVKIGQMMALYGEYFLPEGVTDALHTLEDSTATLEWRAIQAILERELKPHQLAQLDIEKEPLAAASLGQVHRATRRSDGRQLCIKVQYPGVAKSIDSDMNAITSLFNMARLVTSKKAFDLWLREVRTMLHQEVDYHFEAHKTQFIAQMLEGDERYIVPEVFREYSTGKILTTSYEAGLIVTMPEVTGLPLRRRNHISQAALDLFLMEIFDWGEMQTDPNFGNYRIRLGDGSSPDKIVLLDFGAMKCFDAKFLNPFCKMIQAAYEEDREVFLREAINLKFMREHFPREVLDNFADITMEIIEPLSAHPDPQAGAILNEKGQYCWKESNLPQRVARRASQASMSKYFALPPKEFMFINRKLMGVYTFILVLNAQFNGGEYLKRHFKLPQQGTHTAPN